MDASHPVDGRRRAVCAGIAATLLSTGVPRARATTGAAAMLTRPIPASGERLPVIGLGTWNAFDIGDSGSAFDEARAAIAAFAAGGGRVVDSSPMYGRAENALGAAMAAEADAAPLFVATKIWTSGRAAGAQQLADSHRLLRRKTLDLVQVHNLLDVDAHLRTLREAQARGEVRYLGITHYTAGAHAALARHLQAADKPAFVQVNYSIAEPEADARLLRVAAERGVAVLVNRPFAEGAMFSHVRGRGLPPVATELGCTSAAQLFLKWILGNTAVTTVLCGTRKRAHVLDNLSAGRGALPDTTQREAITRWYRGE